MAEADFIVAANQCSLFIQNLRDTFNNTRLATILDATQVRIMEEVRRAEAEISFNDDHIQTSLFGPAPFGGGF